MSVRRGTSGSTMLERLGGSWPRALLDLVLIVGSILIAFALDADEGFFLGQTTP